VRNVAGAIVRLLESEVASRLDNGTHRLQLMYVGPPREVLTEAFRLMTQDGSRDWTPNGSDPVAVLLVDSEGHSMPAVGSMSATCTWDYALGLRLDDGATVILSTPEAWDDLPDSIENTSELLGSPRAETRRPFLSIPPWPAVLDELEAMTGLGRRALRRALGDLFDDGRQLEPRPGALLAWQAAEEALDSKPILLALGLPSSDGAAATEEDLRGGREVLERLADLCGRHGFALTEQELLDARRELRTSEELDSGESHFIDEEDHLRSLFTHLRTASGSGGDFQRAPGAYLRLESPTDWWTGITARDLKALIDRVDTSRPRGRLRITVSPVLETAPLAAEPLLVQDEVTLQVSEVVRSEELPVPSASFARRYPSHAARWEGQEDGRLTDDDIPDHDHPITYSASYADLPQASIKVISLDTFECKGHARIMEATQNPPPARAGRRSRRFEQQITLARAGMHDLVVHTATVVEEVQIVADDMVVHALPGPRPVFQVYLEDGQEMDIVLLSSTGEEVGRWGLGINVEEAAEGVSRSRYEDLSQSHRDGKMKRRAVRARSSQLRDLEQQYMADPRSWLGVIGCWTTAGSALGEINWDTGIAGDVAVPGGVITRPPGLAAPGSYLARRATLLDRVGRLQRPISETTLTEADLKADTEAYLREYLAWIHDDPVAASWADCVALHVRVTAGQSQGLPGTEPSALLLSPFHPVRLAWHVLAQSTLLDALAADRYCPLVGLINPHQSPSVIGLPLQRGDSVDWRPFVAVGSDEVHWSILLNTRDIGNPAIREELIGVLARLGFTPEGPTGGVTHGQARRAMSDVVRILPTRAQVRVGLVGGNLEAAGSVAGVTGWIRETYSEEPIDQDAAEQVAVRGAGPGEVEVFDFRGERLYPTEAALASLAQEVGERVRWFSGQSQEAAIPRLDLVVFDQVETNNLEPARPADGFTSRSVLGHGGLYRMNLREDPGGAQWIRQSRVALRREGGGGLAGALEESIARLEEISLDRAGMSHLRFEPNQQAIAGWVHRSRFVTATSSQVDPACFIRGTGSNSGYLWDYELPGVLDSQDRAGYYLIASPSAAMKDSIRANLRTVVDPPPEVEPILDEISRRGIPVLKRLAAEGSHSRGEIGVLLAVRLLQDAFRPEGSGLRLPVADGDCVHLLIAVDSYREPLDAARKALRMSGSAERADLLVIGIGRQDGRIAIRITPVEIKYVGTQDPVMLPDALNQAENLASLLRRLLVDPDANDLWRACGAALLAEALDQGFRVYADRRLHGLADDAWAQLHQESIDAILGTEELASVVSINDGRVLAFGGWPETRIRDMNADGVLDTAVFEPGDSAFLLTGVGTLSEAGASSVDQLAFRLPGCGGSAVPAARPTSPADQDPEDRALGGTRDDELEAPPDSPETTAETLELPNRDRVRKAFEGFVGNENAVHQLSRDLIVALLNDPPHLSKNILLQGLPSVGKTELARRIARALGLPFVHLDGPSLTSRERLFQLIDGQLDQHGQGPSEVGLEGTARVLEYPPFVVFVDEVHLVSRSVQESLLTMLEPMDRRARLSDTIALVPRATFIFATTRPSRLDPALRSRCSQIDLRPYDLGQVAEMVKRRVESDYNQDWQSEVYLRIAQLGRLVPRLAFALAEDLRNEMIANPAPRSVAEHLEAVRVSMEIDENGLRLLDLDYLDILDRANRAIGEEAIANQLGTVDRDQVVTEIEPALLRLRLIARTQSGRAITAAGREYLANRRFNAP
jgi:DNA phosphorothioation-dependent restriction protein DptH